MKIDKTKLDRIVETLVDYFEYEIEGNSTYGFDVTTTINKDDTDKGILLGTNAIWYCPFCGEDVCWRTDK